MLVYFVNNEANSWLVMLSIFHNQLLAVRLFAIQLIISAGRHIDCSSLANLANTRVALGCFEVGHII